MASCPTCGASIGPRTEQCSACGQRILPPRTMFWVLLAILITGASVYVYKTFVLPTT